ncbi:proline racemase [Moniliophthora roreri MCA 2997]|uniref:trans-L-3-hydroxyproline dehydratase n=1 Tax=Moniliophthora roreri (strain MCA 2997) TaxID=1381753 RepID=V2Y944_MONRO|nr:proline racemase [Moniliophthora roreri MCA 2997]
MDVFEAIASTENVIRVVDMHTSGEPTRIIVSGYPNLKGDTLLEKRRYAIDYHDDIRKLLMLEPRGHDGMYGAILVQETELTKVGEADIGVLFCHNEGYSTMCGHATIALGRFLVDTHDLKLFPSRNSLLRSPNTDAIEIRLHAPCGLIRVSVPTTPEGRADATKPVSFISVPSFPTAIQIDLHVPKELAWPRFINIEQDNYIIPVSVSYGGAFYIIVSAQSLGFPNGLCNANYRLQDFANAAEKLEAFMNNNHRELFTHPTEKDLSFCYGVMMVDSTLKSNDDSNSEAGLCFFAQGQIDRSPTGSCVSARVALAVEEGKLGMNEWWTYESIVSVKAKNNGFRGRAVERTPQGVVVQVEGRAFYSGCSSFSVPEDADVLGKGFTLALPF